MNCADLYARRKPIKQSRHGFRVSGYLAAFAMLAFVNGQTLKPAAAKPSPKSPVSFNKVITVTTTTLMKKARTDGQPDGPINIVLDPIIDGVTGERTIASELVLERMKRIIRTSFPRFRLQPFTYENVIKAPYLLIGTLTAINGAGQPTARRNVYRLCLRMADLKTGTVVSTAVGFAKPRGINPTPVRFFQDRPVFTNDAAVANYALSCHKTKMGGSFQPQYIKQIPAATHIDGAITAYKKGHFDQVLVLYKKALELSGGDQLRVRNGIYLSNLKLNRPRKAAEAFGKLLDYGMNKGKLSVKFLFDVNSDRNFRDSRLAPQYPVWVRKIAEGLGSRSNLCVKVIGHTSRTGKQRYNEDLSLRRATHIMNLIKQEAPRLDRRLSPLGVGWLQNLIGTGRDDASDALDRRVTFELSKC